ncbi:MAG: phage tail protein [Bryobacteraceae bacterium]
MNESYLGQIMLFAGNFAPIGWAFCNGQLLPIAQNQALYTILGITCGGDGVNTFARLARTRSHSLRPGSRDSKITISVQRAAWKQ